MDDSTNTCHREDFAAITEKAKSEETIHRASLEILRRTGVRVYHADALALLRQTDAVITDENLSEHRSPQLVGGQRNEPEQVRDSEAPFLLDSHRWKRS